MLQSQKLDLSRKNIRQTGVICLSLNIINLCMLVRDDEEWENTNCERLMIMMN